MSKKKAIGATHVVIDMPTGRSAKIRTKEEARALAHDFIDLGKRLEVSIQCAATFGDQPLGYAIGPALEAQEALCAIMGDGPQDLREKATNIAGILFEMVDIKDGKRKAEALLKSGKAEKRLREIIEAQGGDPKIMPENIKVGDKKAEITSDITGRVLWINNRRIARVARDAGAPKAKGAGVILNTKLGERVKKGGVLYEIYAERNTELEAAIESAKILQPIGLSKKPEERMLIDRILS
jgi:AMP phosphorylase